MAAEKPLSSTSQVPLTWFQILLLLSLTFELKVIWWSIENVEIRAGIVAWWSELLPEILATHVNKHQLESQLFYFFSGRGDGQLVGPLPNNV